MTHPELPQNIDAERATIDQRRAMWREKARRAAARRRGEDIPFFKAGPKPGYKPPPAVIEQRASAIRKQWAARKIPLADRFWSKVEKTDECWVWKGPKIPKGYGRMQVGERTIG